MRYHPTRLILLLTLFALPLSSALAERGESVMFEPKAHPFTEPPPQQQSESEKCEQLLQQIEALKGKPQRRHAAIERHKKACLE
ncbi:MAG: hypothetical protein JAY99_13230 [Candidatus Thiodiazotropha lotti]|uniref:Uncharacterized protein n=1 Tax=Candidatus Thiodiazotropha endoloripes TaxID=1818881 RepID=A0A1E2ULV1_9GAMM|nr:hypothetical protein [Candidatus Thiodiazotropha endoloripes]MCG7900070.1 hypothetical protein [Candidatus Thiodiazotropha weberae]MCG7991789.1 hypothetical protein [Candidatus Thiodiazotropha lotti]MCG7903614.1 hypothetical protein [Candidatus Thiodiazotropha weberae]MCG8000482.1 hypothetical protein [Candidatus Thiodiazotropha lotti]MCW4183445.1 hypothetical protein [Candidatus Thiodiazotropha weberae]